MQKLITILIFAKFFFFFSFGFSLGVFRFCCSTVLIGEKNACDLSASGTKEKVRAAVHTRNKEHIQNPVNDEAKGTAFETFLEGLG